MANKESTWDTASNRQAETGVGLAQDPEDPSVMDHDDWVRRHRAAYATAREWQDANLRNQWEQNLRTFNNRHPAGSKYRSDAYKQRSKLFRPKTRAAIRKAEANAARAFFASEDIVNLEANDPDDPMQLANAELLKNLLQQRLRAKPIQWFMTALGAYQDTKTVGVCCSKQYWDYEQRVPYIEVVDDDGRPVRDEEGNGIVEPYSDAKPITDEPAIRLIAPENLLIDPGSHWLDPINSSPYVIELIPMYVGDVKDRMNTIDPKTGSPQWMKRTDAEILRARTSNYSGTRQAREDYREDSKENRRNTLYDHDIVWVHETCYRIDGEDWHYFMLGEDQILSEPAPLSDYYLHNQRPWRMGVSIIEAHKLFPASVTQLSQDLQREANEVANQRIDNVRLAMNPRSFVRDGAGIDLKQLNRSTPGGPVTMRNPGGADPDIVVDRPPEVTASAYAEQDRINADFDEIAGLFSTGSVGTARNLNETVGGMELLEQGATEVNDLDLTVFTLTWVEPVLGDIVRLLQAYETDPVMLATAGKKAGLMVRYGISEITDELLSGGFLLNVNAGIGAPNPATRFQKFATLIKGIIELYGDDAPREINRAEVAKESFAIMGYRDGERFLVNSEDQDPAVQQLQQIIDKLGKMLEEGQREGELEMAKEHMKQQGALAKQGMADRTKLLQELMKMAAAHQQQLQAGAGDEAARLFDAAQADKSRQSQQTHEMRGQAFDAALNSGESQAQRAHDTQMAERAAKQQETRAQ